MNGDYIKICRSLLDWEWFATPNTLSVYIYCLLRANWKEGKFEGRVIERGSFVSSVANIAEATGLSIQQTRTALKHLENTENLTIKTTNKYSVITVKNYNRYQDANNQVTNNQQTNNKQITNKQQTNNNNRRKEEGNKGRKEEGKNKNNKEPFYPNDEKLDQAFRDYYEMRKAIKSPMTDRAITLAMNKLEGLSGGDNDKAIEILEQSTMNSWKGLFPLKQKTIIDDWRDAL